MSQVDSQSETLVPRTASKLWVQAAGTAEPTDLSPWVGPETRCVMCGTSVLPGDPARAMQDAAGESFNAKLDCKYIGAAVCRHCQAVRDPRWMAVNMDSKAVAIAGRGVFRLRKKPDVAAFVLQPIESPYVAIWNTRQQAHMIWRTPVSVPCERFREVRLDDEILLIDRQRVMQCVPHWVATHKILEVLGVPRLFAFDISWDLGSTTAGQPRERQVEAVRQHSKEGAEAIAALESLTLADWWALFSVRDVAMDNAGSWPNLTPVEP